MHERLCVIGNVHTLPDKEIACVHELTHAARTGWMSSMHRDRFHLVAEQRDQYQELQMDFQSQSVEVSWW